MIEAGRQEGAITNKCERNINDGQQTQQHQCPPARQHHQQLILEITRTKTESIPHPPPVKNRTFLAYLRELTISPPHSIFVTTSFPFERNCTIIPLHRLLHCCSLFNKKRQAVASLQGFLNIVNQ